MPIRAKSLFENVPHNLTHELVDVLAQCDSVRIERIVSTGQRSPEDFWYDQDEYEWVIVLQGSARLQIEGETESIHLEPGDHVTLPAHCRHRVDWTLPDAPTVWLAVFYRV